MLKECMVSCPKMTVWVQTERRDRRNYIVDTAPICRKFIGQRFSKLVGWMASRFGHVEVFPMYKLSAKPILELKHPHDAADFTHSSQLKEMLQGLDYVLVDLSFDLDDLHKGISRISALSRHQGYPGCRAHLGRCT